MTTKIYICNDCGLENLERYCVWCNSSNCEEVEEK